MKTQIIAQAPAKTAVQLKAAEEAKLVCLKGADFETADQQQARAFKDEHKRDGFAVRSC